jgi:hypothetical protein
MHKTLMPGSASASSVTCLLPLRAIRLAARANSGRHHDSEDFKKLISEIGKNAKFY